MAVVFGAVRAITPGHGASAAPTRGRGRPCAARSRRAAFRATSHRARRGWRRLDARQPESAAREPLVIDNETASVPEQDLDAVAAAPDEDEKVTDVRIERELAAHERGQAIVAAAQIGRLGRKVNLGPRCKRQRASRARTRATYATSRPSTSTRTSPTTTSTPAGSAAVAAVTTGNHRASCSPRRNCQRHQASVCGFTRRRRATSAIASPSSTSRTNCSQNERERLAVTRARVHRYVHAAQASLLVRLRIARLSVAKTGDITGTFPRCASSSRPELPFWGGLSCPPKDMFARRIFR